MTPNIFLWAVSNTGGIRTFFNIRRNGGNCTILSLRQLEAHALIVSELSSGCSLRKGLRWYLYGLFYKCIPSSLNRLRVSVKIAAGVSVVSSIPDKESVYIATDYYTLVMLLRSGFKEIVYYAQHDESLFSDENKIIWSRYRDLILDSNVRVIANSTWLKDRLRLFWREKDISMCLPGVDIDLFRKRPEGSYSHTPRTIISLCRPQAWKGTHILLAAFRRLKTEIPDTTLTLFGSFSHTRDDLSYEGVTFLHNISDDELVESYRGHDLLVNPSFFESSPGPVLEALAVGTPVISTPIGVSDMPYFDECPQAIFKADNVDDLYSKLKLIMTEPPEYNSLRDAGHKVNSRTCKDTAFSFNQIFE